MCALPKTNKLLSNENNKQKEKCNSIQIIIKNKEVIYNTLLYTRITKKMENKSKLMF